MSDTETPKPQEKPQEKPKSTWLNLAVDYGPVLVFFLTYRYFAPSGGKESVQEVFAVVCGTGAFMVAAVIALLVSKLKLGRVSPMLWLSTAMIVVFGGITIWTQDQVYIQIKPTLIYLLFGLALLAGYMRGKALLKMLLEAAFEGLSDKGWMLLSRSWGVFFLCLAALNEGFRHFLSFDAWLLTKLYVFLPLSFLFTFAHMPMLLRHGLGGESKDEVIANPPHE